MADLAWVETASGKKFSLLNPQPEQICIEDIAHSLANQCRFTGHCKFHYSVAQHSYYASLLVPPQDALWALLHDASESFLSDLSRPLKHFTAVGPEYMKLEARVMAVVTKKFGLSEPMPESVHKADNAMLWAEKKQLMSGLSWDSKWGSGHEAADIQIEELSPREAKEWFLTRFYELTSVTLAA